MLHTILSQTGNTRGKGILLSRMVPCWGLIMVSAAPLPTQPTWSSGRSASDLQMLRTAGAILAPMNRHHYHHYYLLFRWYQKTITVVGLFIRVIVEGSWGAKGENSLFSTLSGCRAFLCSLFLGGHKREWQIMVSDPAEILPTTVCLALSDAKRNIKPL